MDGADIFLRAMAQATAVVKQVMMNQLANDTPDTEWNVRDLVNHMLYELSWTSEIVSGMTLEEVGNEYDGDLIEDGASLSSAWQTAADKAELAVGDADLDETAHLSYGDVTIDEYLQEAGNDQLIHAWDVAVAIGMPIKFDPDLARVVYEDAKPRQHEFSQSGLFEGPLEVPDTADLQTKLLALFGRDATWHA
jgi:uncharacterized protein (TIGR03086 family)